MHRSDSPPFLRTCRNVCPRKLTRGGRGKDAVPRHGVFPLTGNKQSHPQGVNSVKLARCSTSKRHYMRQRRESFSFRSVRPVTIFKAYISGGSAIIRTDYSPLVVIPSSKLFQCLFFEFPEENPHNLHWELRYAVLF